MPSPWLLWLGETSPLLRTFSLFGRIGCSRFISLPFSLSLETRHSLPWRMIFKKQYFFNLFGFNWRIIALQYCIGFCHTSTWISHRYTYVPLPLTSLPLTPSHSSRSSQSPGLSSLSHTAHSHRLSILHMAVYMLPCYSLHSSPHLHPLTTVSLFSMSASPLLPCK